jgi:hypothetical protein
MSAFYRKILKQMAKAESECDRLMNTLELNRATIVSRQDTVYEPYQAQVLELLHPLPRRIRKLVERLPDVTKTPKYASVGGIQVKIDRGFDRFVKSYFVSDKFFTKRGYDLEAISNLWEEILDDEKTLADLLDPKLRNGKVSKLEIKSQLETGKTKKAEKITCEERRIETLGREIQKLKEDIGTILNPDSRAVIKFGSRLISLEDVSDWQEQWKKSFSSLLAGFSDQDLEGQKSALGRMYDSITTSGEVVVKVIVPVEQQLSQMELWLNYVSTSAEIDKKRLNPIGVQELKDEAGKIRTLLSGVAKFWIQGCLEIDALTKANSFLDMKYDMLVYIVNDVLKDVNWGWFPGYNDDIEKPFHSDSESHAITGIVSSRTKPGLPASKTSELKQNP